MFLNCFCLYLRRYNVRVKADVGLNRSSVSIVSRPYLEIQHSSSKIHISPPLYDQNQDQWIYPVVKHVDEGGVVVNSFSHHRFSQPFPIKLNWLTVRTYR